MLSFIDYLKILYLAISLLLAILFVYICVCYDRYYGEEGPPLWADCIIIAMIVVLVILHLIITEEKCGSNDVVYHHPRAINPINK